MSSIFSFNFLTNISSLVGGTYAVYKVLYGYLDTRFKMDAQITERSNINGGALVRINLVNKSSRNITITKIDLTDQTDSWYLKSDLYSHFIMMSSREYQTNPRKIYYQPIYSTKYPITINAASSTSAVLFLTGTKTLSSYEDFVVARLETSIGIKRISINKIAPNTDSSYFS